MTVSFFHQSSRSVLRLVVILSLFTTNLRAVAAMKCSQVPQIISHFLRSHFSVHMLDAKLSENVLSNYIRNWDPGKVYFLNEDVEGFKKKFNAHMPEQIEKNDCAAADVVYSLYAKRFDERMKDVFTLIDMKHDFSVDEYLDFDRKNTPFASTEAELKDRWRKRIKFQFMQLKKTIPDDNKVREKLKKRYELSIKQQHELTTDDIYGFFLDAFASALDAHSDYFSPAQLEEFRISTRLSLEGIGALLRSEDGVTTIESLVPGGAASKSGTLKVDDKIVAVAQGEGTPVDVVDMDIRDVVKLIRGAGGTTVKLTIRRGTIESVVPIVREKIQLEDRAAKSKVYNVHNDPKGKIPAAENFKLKVGVIDLPSFYMDFEGKNANEKDFRSSAKDMEHEIQKLKSEKVDAIIVDLRSNGGGSLEAAVSVAGLFNGPGPVVQIKGANTKPYVSKYDGPSIYDGPLILLIDRQSASASEILAAAVQDYDRGLIIGDAQTFGKGTVQNLSDLDESLGAMKVTISKFYRPNGGSTQIRGVSSDIILPSILDYYEVGEKFYEHVLPFERIAPVDTNNFDKTKGPLSELKLASSYRIRTNKNYAEIFKAVDQYISEKDERSKVSLKEKSKAEQEKEKKLQKELEETEKDAKKDMYGNFVRQLKDDVNLQEAIFIAADYSQLLGGKKIGSMVIDELKEIPKEKTAAQPKKAAQPAVKAKPAPAPAQPKK